MKKLTLAIVAATVVLAGCANDGRYYRSDTYQAGAVNQAQQAQVAVSNTDNRSDAKTIGTIIGAIAGAAIGSHNNHDTTSRVLGGLAGGAIGNIAGGAVAGDRTSYVDGVQLTFRYNNKLYNSAQVGRVCEFKPGLAVMISTTPTETRIQPNNPGGCGQ